MVKRLLGVVLVVGVAGGCGVVPTAQPAPASPTEVALPLRESASAMESAATPSEERAGYEVPDDPCRVLSAATRSRLGMKKADRFDPACKWSNDPGSAPPLRIRDLKIFYEAGPARMNSTDTYAKMTFARKSKNDYRQPSEFASTPSVKRAIKQVGSAKAGEHFDEGYYVYYVTTIAGARQGEGKTVLRKGNVIVTIIARGADIPTRTVRDGNPIGDAVVQAMIDAVAAEVVAAIR
ncbi:hypothetical protein EDD27_9321 [Nonomuraea polychroma]|uniref:DUF3558 domain-containing protein n=1 Tax=Nonomuraea polychroma TaxID=46176 RepID=A0A438ML24_9ACTN|nr:hypothetical protein [Nonomuraea polychroma]RVX46437.1 hypothetical protein EDD27_9321 [Nonomuraea polychroma]